MTSFWSGPDEKWFPSHQTELLMRPVAEILSTVWPVMSAQPTATDTAPKSAFGGTRAATTEFSQKIICVLRLIAELGIRYVKDPLKPGHGTASISRCHCPVKTQGAMRRAKPVQRTCIP
jgi:hypothetical protein